MPEIKNTEELTVVCDNCSDDASVALCIMHMDERIEEARKEGYDEGYEEAKDKFYPAKEEMKKDANS